MRPETITSRDLGQAQDQLLWDRDRNQKSGLETLTSLNTNNNNIISNRNEYNIAFNHKQPQQFMMLSSYFHQHRTPQLCKIPYTAEKWTMWIRHQINSQNCALIIQHSSTRSSQVLTERPETVYSLRSRKHSKSLIDKSTDLNYRHFLIRAVYKDCYWLQL